VAGSGADGGWGAAGGWGAPDGGSWEAPEGVSSEFGWFGGCDIGAPRNVSYPVVRAYRPPSTGNDKG
jgi:hypothetical protein